jgi:hypothetical protein
VSKIQNSRFRLFRISSLLRLLFYLIGNLFNYHHLLALIKLHSSYSFIPYSFYACVFIGVAWQCWGFELTASCLPLPLNSCPQSFSLYFSNRVSCFCPGPASYCNPPDLCLLSSWDYRVIYFLNYKSWIIFIMCPNSKILVSGYLENQPSTVFSFIWEFNSHHLLI